MKFTHTISPEELEKIERFLTTEMNESEATAFSAELTQNDELQEKTEEVKLLLLGIKEASLENYLFNTATDVRTITDKKKKNVFVLNVKTILVAASIALVVGLFTWFVFQNRGQNKQIYSQYYSPDPGLATVMSVVSDYDFEKAMVEYKNGEYDKALRAWNNLLKQKSKNDTLIYFIAAANQAKGNQDIAIENLQQIVLNKESAFYKDACWYLGLAYLKKGETAEAINYIKKSEYPKAEVIIQAINKK